MRNIVWLASFPRSGNTWLKLILTDLLFSSGKSLEFSNSSVLHCANRRLFDNTLNFPTTLLSAAEVNELRPGVYKEWSDSWGQYLPLIIKVHDCFEKNRKQRWLFPSDITRLGIYVIRNPLDICVSYAHFWGLDGYDEAADMICDPFHSLPKDETDLFGQLRQRLGDWSLNVQSWTADADFPLNVVKYEDMKSNPVEIVSEILNQLGMSFEKARVVRSVERCHIGELQKQESEVGFKDRPYRGERFFRQGAVGSWRNTLPDEISKRIIHAHSDMMKKFGYLSLDGQPLI
tara:strand:+ start:1152 stop:2018 length:867 start_codon:yes stop_codon:yes gene_type:complete